MSSPQRPTAREIVEGVVQAMHDAHEPLDRDVVLVPAIYDVLIHPGAYRQLEPILSRIRMQATQRLEREIERLNRSSGISAGRLLRPLLRLFYPEHRLRRLSPGAQQVERSGDAWMVDVLVTADPTARLDFLAVETDFGGRISPVMRGDTGLSLRRRTTRMPDGGYETILITPPSGVRPARRTTNGKSESAEVATMRTPPEHAVARFDYEDLEGRHTAYMEKRRIVIGRADDSGVDLDIRLRTQADVSREHVVIRHDGDAFEIKNLGRYGTRVNGRRLDPAGQWHPLPRTAEINLADAVVIRFEVL